MAHNRLPRGFVMDQPLPTPHPVACPKAFVLCPVSIWHDGDPIRHAAMMQLYERALREAEAVVRPPLQERPSLIGWN